MDKVTIVTNLIQISLGSKILKIGQKMAENCWFLQNTQLEQICQINVLPYASSPVLHCL